MLQRVKLTNFQRHRALEVTFGAGLTALRGANEAGKSTLLRGVCYAIFGVSALADSIEETVTWGEDPKTMKAEADLVIDGVVYSIKRSKGGAEVQYDGGSVTGQKEVTKFICDRMGVDPAAATRLMLSNQNEIRGALEAGPKATTELIERLAEFSQIDDLIDLMESELSLGSSVAVEQQIASAEALLEQAKAEAQPRDMSENRLAATRVTEQLTTLAQAEEESDALVQGLTRRVAEDKALRQQAQQHAQRLRDAGARLSEAEAKVNTLTKVESVGDFADQVAAVEAQIAQAKQASQTAAIYAAVSPYFAGRPADSAEWDDDVASLVAEISAKQAAMSTIGATLATLNGEVLLAEQKKLAGSCTFCGKDFSNVPEVAERNAQADRQIAEARDKIGALKAQAAEHRGDIATMQGIQKASAGALQALIRYPDHVEALDDSLPPVLGWRGPTPGRLQNLAELDATLAQLRQRQKAYDDAQAALPHLRESVAQLAADIEVLRQTLPPTPDDSLAGQLDTARSSLESIKGQQRAGEIQLANLNREVEEVERTRQRAEQRVGEVQAQLGQAQQALVDLKFNNALLKRVRAARPLIADKLWNLVLSAVSSYFSEMRGERSVVTKESDGFRVNGHSVSTLSGSTLDILGLAIRIALVRTFLPTAPFLVLDEPAAACDEGRTEGMLGFMVGCGFGQILLITHEDVSESVANNVVTIGEGANVPQR